MSNYDNGHKRDKWFVEMYIDHLKKAINNLGKDNMQQIRISAHPHGMGTAMQCGEYIDLSHEPFVYKGIKESLTKMLEIQEEILEEIKLETQS